MRRIDLRLADPCVHSVAWGMASRLATSDHAGGATAQRHPGDTRAVAFGEQMYVVVWRKGWTGKGGKARIFAARISADGKMLDPGGIPIAPGRARVSGPSARRVRRRRVPGGLARLQRQ